MSLYSPRQWASALAILFGIGFILCFARSYTIADPALKALHMAFLGVSFFGFSGLTLGGFVSGLVQSAVWGLLAGWALASLLNLFSGRRSAAVPSAANAGSMKKEHGGGCCH